MSIRSETDERGWKVLIVGQTDVPIEVTILVDGKPQSIVTQTGGELRVYVNPDLYGWDEWQSAESDAKMMIKPPERLYEQFGLTKPSEAKHVLRKGKGYGK